MKEISFFEEKAVHFKSKSGSYYFYTAEGVFRYSNHWGRVATCRWKIKGIDAYKSQDFYVGYSRWEDFYPLNDSDVIFYIEVDFNTEQAKIRRLNSEGNNQCYLMDALLVHKRLKQIQNLFKEYKWAKYIPGEIDELREMLIKKLLNTNKSLDVLKRELKIEVDKNQ